VRLTVALTPPYEVVVETGVLARAGEHVRAAKVALISNERVAPLYAETVSRSLEAAGSRVFLYTVPDTEDSKSLTTLEHLLRRMAGDGLNRGSAVVALGGGVVSDLAGFAAASYMRGVALYTLPTTLLAMVDAAVGGKTGVNLPEGKNLVGAFWQPKAVLMDPAVLATLPAREFRGGAVELFKHGLLADPQLLEDAASPDFRPDGPAGFLEEVVARSVRVKADIVAEDEREGGQRAFLNLGHTLAHALEAYTDHALAHGDAVAYGLLFAARLAAARGYADETARVAAFVRWVRPAPLPQGPLAPLLPFIARDKKHLDAQRWVLLRSLGAPFLADDVSEDELQRAWSFLQATVQEKEAPRR
jgi:3-dehydroquinate synthase